MCRQRANIRLSRKLIVLIGLNVCFSGFAAAADTWEHDEITYRKLEHFRQIYAQEIYAFCTEIYDKSLSRLKKCLHRQTVLKNHILKAAQDQFGTRLLAQLIYDECLARNPLKGVSINSHCVNTRIMLNARIRDNSIEKVIFQTCDAKWRKHGYKAVHNCCIHSANYYLRYGEMREP